MEKLRVGDDNNDELGSGEASSSSASLALNDPRRYLPMRVIGSGSFGVVYQARDKVTNEIVAIKKVLEDSRFKNRELQIMQELSHPNTVQMRASFVLSGKKHGETYLNLVLEYVPEALYNVLRHYLKARSHMPAYIIKVYLYQVARSLAYIHSLGICHRDIKPQNLLLDPQTHVLKLCDFGSAKRLIEGEPNISYICSRYYRAPELIFGSTSYTFSIDIWSLGCVFGEMLLGSPLFPGTSGVDQLVEIIKVLGTPTREQIRTMNSNYSEFKFPQIRAHSWDQVLRGRADEQALDLISKMLQYSPAERPTAVEMLAHPYFDELRTAKSFPNGKPLPPLMDFTEDEERVFGDMLDRIRGTASSSSS